MHYPISMISIPVSNTYTAHVRLNRVEIFCLLTTCWLDEIYPETEMLSLQKPYTEWINECFGGGARDPKVESWLVRKEPWDRSCC